MRFFEEEGLGGQQSRCQSRTVDAESLDDVWRDGICPDGVLGMQDPPGKPVSRHVGGEVVGLRSVLHVCEKPISTFSSSDERAKAELGIRGDGGGYTGVAGTQCIGDVEPITEELLEDLHVSRLHLGLL